MQSIPRESMLLLRMLASGHQLQLLAFELKRVAADLGVVSNALFNCRRNSIEACKVIHEASERPPIGSWEAVWKHFAELEHTEALHTVIVSRLLQTIDSLRIAGE